MRIVIDLQACQSENRFQGTGRYSMALAQAMARQAGEHDIWILLNGRFTETIAPICHAFDGLVPKERFAVFSLPGPVAEINPNNVWRTRVGECLREHFLAGLQPDIVHVASLFEGESDDAVTSVGTFDPSLPTAVTLCDLVPLIQQESHVANERIRDYCLRKVQSLKNSDLLLSISEYLRQEAITALNLPENRVVTIPSAVDDRFGLRSFSLAESEKILGRYGITRTFVLCASCGFNSFKNIERLIEDYAQLPGSLRQSHQLVIAGKIPDRQRLHLTRYAGIQGLASHEMVLTGYVLGDDLVALYNLCKLFVFPSFHEGAGLSALEAMACGAPVIGSSTSNISGAIDRGDALFDSPRTELKTQTISRALTDEVFRQSLREHALQQAAKFSWDESARCVLEEFGAVHEQRQAAQRALVPISACKPRLAFVSPLPPEKSGISDYSAELLPELARYYDITLIVDQYKVKSPWLNANFSIRDVAWFEANAKRFDRVLYQVGNSLFHKHMFGLLRRHPGVVVLHDFYLSGALHGMEATGYAPRSFQHSLYDSHGYPALAALGQCAEKAAFSWPCNKAVLDHADGVIVHSRYAIDAARRWYNRTISREMRKIPQLISVPNKPNREHARAELNIAEDSFLVCSFGMLGPTKLCDRLLDAWLASKLAKDPRSILMFVGENPGGDYGHALLAKIRNSGVEDRVRITGFANAEQYHCYLAAADTAVQLRTLSRGETSRAALETMAHGLPIIVNANGPMAEYPDDILIKLPDDFRDAALIGALENLHEDAALRLRLGQAGRCYVAQHHAPDKIGKQYFDVIEYFAETGAYARYRSLLASLASIVSPNEPNETDLAQIAQSIAINTPKPRQQQLLLDISALVQTDLKTGIERVTRSVMLELLKRPPEGLRVEPIYSDGLRYRYAKTYTLDKLSLSDFDLTDSVVEVQKGDIYLSLEWNTSLCIDSKNQLRQWRGFGVDIFFIVFDLLPLLEPDCFPPYISPSAQKWLETIIEISTGLLCISRSVADEVKEWLTTQARKREDPLWIGYFHLGADIENSAPTKGLPDDASLVFKALKLLPSFLIVGTIEPRKGQAQTLSAFEQLWAEGLEANLVIVGKQGWMVESLVERLKHHPQLGKRLFWLQGISDEYLEKVYDASTALIAASEGEGFGLPLIEAAQHKLPIIARDIPVFREVAGNHAFYFSGKAPDDLVRAIKSWFELHVEGSAPRSDDMPWLTWRQSTQQLLEFILNGSCAQNSKEK